jgi:hypothetical protein
MRKGHDVMAPWNLRPAEDRDPFTTVIGLNGSTYSCPDIATLDSHLVALSARLRHAEPLFPSLAESFRTEMDRLLDRRLWLEWELNAAPNTDAA